MRHYYLVIFALLPLLGWSQSEQTRFAYQQDSLSIGFNTVGHINATSLNRSLLTNYNSDGFLTTAIKDELLGLHGLNNRIGGALDAAMYASIPSNHGVWYVAVSDRQILHVNYPKDLFELALYGNYNRSNHTIAGAPLSFQSIRYQQVETGWFKNWNDQHTTLVAAGIINGEQLYDVQMETLNITTDDLGESLTIELLGTATFSDTARKSFANHNGTGANMAIGHRFSWADSIRSQSVSLELQDVGFIQWNSNAMHYSMNSEVTYNGVEVDNLFAVNDTSFSELDRDSVVQTFIGDPNVEKVVTSLPPRLLVSWAYSTKDNNFSAAFLHQFSTGYVPYVVVGYQRNWSSHVCTGTKIGYGGYGKWAIGLNAGMNYERFRLLIGTNNLEQFITPSKSMGTSLYVGGHFQL